MACPVHGSQTREAAPKRSPSHCARNYTSADTTIKCLYDGSIVLQIHSPPNSSCRSPEVMPCIPWETFWMKSVPPTLYFIFRHGVSRSWISKAGGGAEKVAFTLCKELHQRGYNNKMLVRRIDRSADPLAPELVLQVPGSDALYSMGNLLDEICATHSLFYLPSWRVPFMDL